MEYFGFSSPEWIMPTIIFFRIVWYLMQMPLYYSHILYFKLGECGGGEILCLEKFHYPFHFIKFNFHEAWPKMPPPLFQDWDEVQQPSPITPPLPTIRHFTTILLQYLRTIFLIKILTKFYWNLTKCC